MKRFLVTLSALLFCLMLSAQVSLKQLMIYGNTKMYEGDYAKAIEYYERALKEDGADTKTINEKIKKCKNEIAKKKRAELKAAEEKKAAEKKAAEKKATDMKAAEKKAAEKAASEEKADEQIAVEQVSVQDSVQDDAPDTTVVVESVEPVPAVDAETEPVAQDVEAMPVSDKTVTDKPEEQVKMPECAMADSSSFAIADVVLVGINQRGSQLVSSTSNRPFSSSRVARVELLLAYECVGNPKVSFTLVIKDENERVRRVDESGSRTVSAVFDVTFEPSSEYVPVYGFDISKLTAGTYTVELYADGTIINTINLEIN